MMSFLLFHLLASLALAVVAQGSGPCPSGHFLNIRNSRCTLCSSCPDNQVIKIPCTLHSDIVCGPLYAIDFFPNQGNNGNLWGESGTDTRMDPDTDVPVVELVTYEYNSPGTRRSGDLTRSRNDIVEADPDRWKELCFGLIGAMAAVTLLALMYVVITHTKQRRGTCKHSSLPDPESPVVYYHSQVLSRDQSPDRVVESYLPHLENQLQENQQKKILKRIFQPGTSTVNANEYVDELYDPKNSATPFLLHPIPESEIPTFPLAMVHKNDKKRQAKAKQNQYHTCCSATSAEVPAAQVTELLLNHHRCTSATS